VVFDVNQRDFKNKFQKDVWELGKTILPLEITMTGIVDSELREGCTQIYNFSHDVLEDMYNNIEKYEDNAADYYLAGFLCELIKGKAVLDESELSWKIPVLKNKWEEMFSLLAPFGFSYMVKTDCVILQNKKYPLYLKYWYKLHKLAPNGAANRGTIGACDFRYFSKAKRQTVDDLLLGLSDKDRACFKELHDYVVALGAKKQTDLFRYNYKKEHVILFDKNPCILVSYKTQSKNSLKDFIAIVKKQSDSSQICTYITNKTEVCVPCGHPLCKTSNEIFLCFPNGDGSRVRQDIKTFEVDGVTMRASCRYDVNKGNKNNDFYTDEDVSMIKRLVDIRFAQINNT